jgi:hypothetical protein
VQRLERVVEVVGVDPAEDLVRLEDGRVLLQAADNLPQDGDCCRNSSEPSLTRGRPAPYRPRSPRLSRSAVTASAYFFQSTPNGGFASR